MECAEKSKNKNVQYIRVTGRRKLEDKKSLSLSKPSQGVSPFI